MARKIIWFIAGSIGISMGMILFLRQDLLHSAFSCLLANPLVPISGALALWAIISLLGEKNLKKATWLELVAVGTLFHEEFSSLFRSILYSLSNLWRML